MRGFCYQSLCPVGKKNEGKVLDDLGGCVYLGTAINAWLHSPIARALLPEVKKNTSEASLAFVIVSPHH